MPFHGYGQSDCASYDENYDGQNYHANNYRRHPERPQVPGHANDGPVDLSRFGTPTGRGTWRFGRKQIATASMPVGTDLEQQMDLELKAEPVNGSESGSERGEQESSLVSQVQASVPLRSTPKLQGSLQTPEGTYEVEDNTSQVTPFPHVLRGYGTGGNDEQDLDGAREVKSQIAGKQPELCDNNGSGVLDRPSKQGAVSKDLSPDVIISSQDPSDCESDVGIEGKRKKKEKASDI